MLLTLDHQRLERVGCWGNEYLWNAQSLGPLPNDRHAKSSNHQQHILLICKDLAVQDQHLELEHGLITLFLCQGLASSVYKELTDAWGKKLIVRKQLNVLSYFPCWRYGTKGSSPGSLSRESKENLMPATIQFWSSWVLTTWPHSITCFWRPPSFSNSMFPWVKFTNGRPGNQGARTSSSSAAKVAPYDMNSFETCKSINFSGTCGTRGRTRANTGTSVQN